MRKIIVCATLLAAICALLLLSGCNRAGSAPPAQSSAEPAVYQEQTAEQADVGVLGSTTHAITYNDETRTELRYETFCASTPYRYYLKSETVSDSGAVFKCSPNGDWNIPNDDVFITVEKIVETPFETWNAVAFLTGFVDNFTYIRIYEGIDDDTGITDLYCVGSETDEKAYARFGGEWYMVSADANVSEIWFSSVPSPQPTLAIYSNGSVTETIDNANDAHTYEITHDGSVVYTVSLERNEAEVALEIRNSSGERVMELANELWGNQRVVEFFDLNTDGYMDISVMTKDGALNTDHDLYVWDNEDGAFVPVSCDEMLSYFEVSEGYIRNWQKRDSQSGVVQKFIWEGYSLILDSEESYTVD